MFYKVRNWCEDEVVYKYTDQVVLDSGWQAPECVSGTHTTRDFIVLKSNNPCHGSRAYRTANQSIPNNSETIIQYDAVDYDHNSEMDIVTNKGRFTPTQAGVYFVSAVVHFASSSDMQRYCNINKNGSKEWQGAREESPDDPDAGLGICTVTGLVEMNGTTDYIEIVAYQQSGGSLNALGTRILTTVAIAIWRY